MLVLDTNVLSELMKPKADPAVREWIVSHGMDVMATTAICQAQIEAGIAVLTDGRRKQALQEASERLFLTGFLHEILAFDTSCVSHYADIIARRRRLGEPIEAPDAMIAAIARNRDAAIVTRNIRDFEGCEITLHDPWRTG